MAGQGFTGTPEDFQKAFADVSDIKGQMDSNLKTLRGKIEDTRAGWKGTAGDAFQEVMADFDAKAAGINNALQHIADMLQQSGHSYKAAEEETNAAVSGMRQGIL